MQMYLVLSQKSSKTCTKDHPKFIIKKVNYCIQHFSCIIPSWTKTDDSVNLDDDDDDDDDDDSIFNLVLQLQRYGNGNVPEVYLVLSQKSSETCMKDHPKFILKKKT